LIHHLWYYFFWPTIFRNELRTN